MTIQHKMILTEAKDYLFIVLGLLIYTIAFTVFLMPYQIVAGGVTGLSAIIYYATGFHLENTYIIINGVLLVVALKILGVKFLMKTIFAIFTLYFMLMFAQELIPKQENGLPFKLMGEGQDFMSMIIGCVLTGIALATVFTHNGSTGGTDIIAASVNKFHPNVSLGNVLIAADFCIIGSCMFFPQFGTYLERAHKGDGDGELYARLRDECPSTVCAVLYLLTKVAGDSQRYWYRDESRCNHPRWSRVVYRKGDEGTLYPRQEERERQYVPSYQDDRP